MTKLVLFAGAPEQEDVPLDGRERLVLGRNPGSDVVLQRRMASRTHAVIELRGDRYIIRDHDSYNGTMVNRRHIVESELYDGDEILIANVPIRFVDSADAARGGDPQRSETARVLVKGTIEDELVEITQDDIDKPAEAPAASPTPLPTATSAPSRKPAAAPDGAPARAESEGPGTLAEPTQPIRSRPAPPPRSSGWPYAVLGIGIVAIALVVVGARSRPPVAEPAPESSPSTPEEAEFRSIDRAPREQRPELLWGYVGDHPAGAHTEEAYLELLDSGASRELVCEYAANSSPGLMVEGGSLYQRCSAP